MQIYDLYCRILSLSLFHFLFFVHDLPFSFPFFFFFFFFPVFGFSFNRFSFRSFLFLIINFFFLFSCCLMPIEAASLIDLVFVCVTDHWCMLWETISFDINVVPCWNLYLSLFFPKLLF